MKGLGPQQQQKTREADRSAFASAGATPAPGHAPHPMRSIGELHRAIGNQAVSRLLQRKLVVNAPGDAYEQEADRVADAVMRATPESPPSALSRAAPMPRALQRECSCGSTCDDCRKEQALQRKEGSAIGIAGAGTAAPPIVHDVLRSPGAPLDARTRAFMEPRFGRSFADVRIHADTRAAESARSIHAAAYTVAKDVVFGAGRYAPYTPSGQRLLAHELTHVVQQGAGSAHRRPKAASDGRAEGGVGPIGGSRGSIRVTAASAPQLARADEPPSSGAAGQITQNLVKQLQAEGKPIVANIGGTGASHEPAHAININPNLVAPRKDIPNFVQAKGETIGSLFQAGQVNEVVGYGLSPPVFDWERIAQGSYKVLQEGGVFRMHFRWPDPASAKKLTDALAKEGFKNIQNVADAMITAVKAPSPTPRLGGGPSAPPTRRGGGVGPSGGATAEPLGAGVKPSISPETEMPGSGARPRVSARGGVNIGFAKFIGVTLLDMANRYFMAKEEAERAVAKINKAIAGSDVEKLKNSLIEREHLEIARKQFRGVTVYVTVFLELRFTNDVLDTFSIESVRLTDSDQSQFTTSVMSHEPIFGVEGKVWWVKVSMPVEQFEIEESERIKFRLEQLDEIAGAPASVDEKMLEQAGEERRRLLERQRELTKQAEIAKKEALESPTVISDPKKREQQQRELSVRLRQLAEKKKPPEPKKEQMPEPAAGPPPLIAAPAPPQLELLPGAPAEGPVEKAARAVKNFEVVAQRLLRRGSLLEARLGGDNRPSERERQSFLVDEEQWRTALKYMQNWFKKEGRDEAVAGLGELLERLGRRLSEIRTHLGG